VFVLLDSLGCGSQVECFTATFFVPEELSDSNSREFSTPNVYRIANVPLIEPNTEELSLAYYDASFDDDVGSLSHDSKDEENRM
jgi:hypothetical protein